MKHKREQAAGRQGTRRLITSRRNKRSRLTVGRWGSETERSCRQTDQTKAGTSAGPRQPSSSNSPHRGRWPSTQLDLTATTHTSSWSLARKRKPQFYLPCVEYFKRGVRGFDRLSGGGCFFCFMPGLAQRFVCVSAVWAQWLSDCMQSELNFGNWTSWVTRSCVTLSWFKNKIDKNVPYILICPSQ